MSKLEVSVGLDTSGRKGAGSLCREPQSTPQKNGWFLKSLKPFLPRRTSFSQMSPVMKERAFSEISGPEEGNSKYSWGLKNELAESSKRKHKVRVVVCRMLYLILKSIQRLLQLYILLFTCLYTYSVCQCLTCPSSSEIYAAAGVPGS